MTTPKEPHEVRAEQEQDETPDEQPATEPGEEGSRAETDSPDPDGSSDSSSESEQSDEAGSTLDLGDVPGSSNEIKDRAKNTINRAKKISGAPAREIGGGVLNRIFDAVDDFMDRWEGKK